MPRKHFRFGRSYNRQVHLPVSLSTAFHSFLNSFCELNFVRKERLLKCGTKKIPKVIVGANANARYVISNVLWTLFNFMSTSTIFLDAHSINDQFLALFLSKSSFTDFPRFQTRSASSFVYTSQRSATRICHIEFTRRKTPLLIDSRECLSVKSFSYASTKSTLVTSKRSTMCASESHNLLQASV